jgi:hypothetical protein
MPWDWILVESYRVLRCLCSQSIRNIYGSPSHGRATLGVTWPATGIASGGRYLGVIRAIPSSEAPGWRGVSRRLDVEFSVDPWPALLEFSSVALSRSGYRHHEAYIRGIARETAMEFWFPWPHPLRDVVVRYPL